MATRYKWLFISIALLMITSAANAVQPALELPQWAELSLRFTSPPVIGSTTDIVGEMRCLLGEGKMGILSLELPPGLRIVSGRPTVRVRLVRSRNQRVALRVAVEKPCPKGRVTLTLKAPYPKKAVEKEIVKQTRNRQLRRKRLQFLNRVDKKQTLSASLRLHISHFESVTGAKDVVWRRIARGPSSKGLFILRPSPLTGQKAAVKERLRAFERHEHILRRNPRLRKKVATLARGGRRQKVVAYGEDLFALATYLYADEPSCAPAIAALRRKAERKKGVLRETIAALRNLEALALLHKGQMRGAVEVWVSLCEMKALGSLRAYALFNAGEALRISGARKDALEFFKSAINLRPGLTIARKRVL